MRRIRFGILIVALMTISFAAPQASANADPSAGWIVGCPFSHRSTDDPIVMPGMRGMSHSHDFFGNDTTDANSTVESLLGASTTCSFAGDTAAYWAPTLYVGRQAVTPIKAAIYYRNQVTGAHVQPFPLGLRMLAGNSHANGPQPLDIVYYNCHEGPDPHEVKPYDCGSNTVDAHVRFPQCWDGVNLDSADHMSHMAYPVRSHGVRSCPATHPVVLPRLIIRISWPITNGNDVTLASGPTYTLHADFFNAWDENVQAQLVDQCINNGVDCGKQIGTTINLLRRP